MLGHRKLKTSAVWFDEWFYVGNSFIVIGRAKKPPLHI